MVSNMMYNVISIFQFLRPEKNMKFIHGGHFEFQ